MDTFLQVIIAAALFVLTMVVVNQIMKWITKESPKQDAFYKRVREWFNRHRKQ